MDEHHLHLGPKSIDGEVKNSIESAVLALKNNAEDLCFDNKLQIMKYIKDNQSLVKEAKAQLTKNVPYRLLSAFMSEAGGKDKLWDQKTRLMEYIIRLNDSKLLPYIIEDGRGLTKKVIIDSTWKSFFLENMVVLRYWVREHKVEYLQKRNPNVPGIVYKLESERMRVRKLAYVRGLGSKLLTLQPMKDIYSGKPPSSEKYEVDHFVPSPYIAHDEIWNLLPMDSSLNSQKSNKLPKWNKYFPLFASGQHYMYYTVFVKGQLRDDFNKCYRDNIISPWAQEELFVPGKIEKEFKGLLERNLHPIYDAARSQGYQYWNVLLKELA
ncbi:MAG: HNH endonuclease domain-containing protein [Lachnospiraceae bacterium]|nr:HNH endonuclease domain-containing protein [Lachnospiraceae bacterium]